MNARGVDLGAEVDWGALGRALAVLAPLALLIATTDKPVWLQVSIVTVSAFIAVERSALAPAGVLLHGAVMMAGFLLLLLSWPVPALFVLLCALLAGGAVLLTVHGARLRSLGNFTFIPALHLAYKTASGSHGASLADAGAALLPYMAVALLPPLVLAVGLHGRHRGSGVLPHLARLLREQERGESGWSGEAQLAVVLAVATAAALVEWQRLGHGQWLIWSAASVVTGDVVSARLKLRERSVGALFGVPVGMVLGLWLPHDAVLYGVLAFATLLSLVTFRRYIVGFGLRCAFAALSILVAGQTLPQAAERVENVLLGGAIGIFFVLLAHAVVVGWPWGRGRRP